MMAIMLNYRKSCASSNSRKIYSLMTRRSYKNLERTMQKHRNLMEAEVNAAALARILKVLG